MRRRKTPLNAEYPPIHAFIAAFEVMPQWTIIAFVFT
jgi:hypothetical protein